METLKDKIKSHSTLIKNFNYLSLLNFFDLFIPLLTYPYLIRVLGKENYGIFVFSQGIIAFILVFINFGFNISEIKEISANRDSINKVSKIFSSVLTIKTFLASIAITLLLFFIYFFPNLNAHKWLYLASITLLINGIINPTFYFQGIEEMKTITILSITSKTLFLFLIFLIIKQPSHYIYVPLIIGLGSIAASITGLVIIFVYDNIRLQWLSTNYLRKVFKSNIPFFGSRMSVVTINKSNVLLLGSFIGYNEVAYYDLAHKLTNVLQVPYQIMNSVLFPNVSKTKNVALVIKVLKVFLVLYIIGYLLVFLGAEPIIKILGGVHLIPAKTVLYILGIKMVTGLVSVLLGAPVLLALGYKQSYNNSIIWSSLAYFIIIFLLYIFEILGLYSIAIASVCTSAFMMIYRIYYCKKHKIL